MVIEIERAKQEGTLDSESEIGPTDDADLIKIGAWLEQHDMQHCKENMLSEGIVTVDDLRAFVAKREDFE